ncbi:MAG: hypothetical protein Q8920_11480 [Bacillota bacterium]|nr:hypothetical protein [Bacillota bacterium]
MALNSVQITALHWFYRCHVNGEPANYKGSIQHFGEVLKISEPMNVIMSLYEMGLIGINKSKLEVTITKAGIQQIDNLKNSKK